MKDAFEAQWPAPARVRTLVTTRSGGSSRDPFAENNLAFHVGDSAADVSANRKRLDEQLGDDVQVQWLRQVHGVAAVEAGTSDTPEADACLTRTPGRACAVLTADCLPVLVCDRQAAQVAAAHAGWRGLAAGVLVETLRRFAAPPADLLVWLGPAISQAHFEVGPEVRDGFLASPLAQQLGGIYTAGIDAAFRVAPGGDRPHGDLFAVARAQCQALGVNGVYGGALCSYADRRFYSYRREGRTGRMASLIWLAE